ASEVFMRFRIRVYLVYVGIALGITAYAWGQTAAPVDKTAPAPSITLPGLPQRLTLKQAADLLVQRNLAVLAARYDIDAARAVRLVASLRPNPTVTLGMEQINPAVSPKSLTRPVEGHAANTTYTTRVDQIIERGGKRRLRTEAAQYNVEAAEAQLLDVL